MCGPSKQMKAINSSIQDFAGQVKSEAGDIFGASSDVFHKIMNSVSGVLTGGPSQYGFSAGEDSARRAEAVQMGATEARNLRGAAAASAGAIGGGNVVAPAGATQEAILSANQKAAADTAMAQNQITQEGFTKGERIYDKALDAAGKAPDVFNPSTAANQGVTAAQNEAEQSQQNIDTQSNWAMNDIMKLGTAAVSSWATGGFKLPGGGGSKGPTQ